MYDMRWFTQKEEIARGLEKRSLKNEDSFVRLMEEQRSGGAEA